MNGSALSYFYALCRRPIPGPLAGGSAAAKDVNLSIPLVVRLAGTNFELGKEILNNSNLRIIAADNLADAAKKIVAAVNNK